MRAQIEVWNDQQKVTLLDIEKMRARNCSRTPLEDAANIAKMLMGSCRSDSLELLLAAMANVTLPYGASQEERQRFINCCLIALNSAQEWDK